jgi:hypothetical protein
LCLLAPAHPPLLFAQSLVPTAFPALRDIARDFLRQDRHAESVELFRTLTAADSTNGGDWLGLGDGQLGAGDSAAALVSIKIAVGLGFGQHRSRAYQVAQIHAGLGQKDSALVWLARALAAGYERRMEVSTDPAFSFMAQVPEFRKLALVPAASGEVSRDDGWRSDLAVLVAEAKRLSTGPVRVATTPAFDSAAAVLSARIPELTNEGIYAELQRLVTLLRQGHSVLYPVSTPRLTLEMLPVDLYLFRDGLFIVGGVGPGQELIGSRVEAIAGIAPREALQRIAPFVTRDNPMGVVWNGPYFLLYPALLRAAGIATDLNQVHLTLRDAAGTSREVSLRAGEFRPPGKLTAPPLNRASRPLWLRHPDRNYWIQALPRSGAVYAQYNQVIDDESWTIAQFADSLLKVARRPGVERLIIDVRRNNGGSSQLNIPLNRAIVAIESLGGPRQVYILMGRNTISAAQNFLNDVDQVARAIFVGEPSSSRPNFVGEDTQVMLPYSGIMGSLASRYFQDSDPLDDRVWIAPDIPITLSSQDYFAGRDPVLTAALAHRFRRYRPH